MCVQFISIKPQYQLKKKNRTIYIFYLSFSYVFILNSSRSGKKVWKIEETHQKGNSTEQNSIFFIFSTEIILWILEIKSFLLSKRNHIMVDTKK